jgi:hypothetical protein
MVFFLDFVLVLSAFVYQTNGLRWVGYPVGLRSATCRAKNIVGPTAYGAGDINAFILPSAVPFIRRFPGIIW